MAIKKSALVLSKNGKDAGETIALNEGAPVKIKALANTKYLLKTEDGVAPENATLTRVGDDLQLTLEGGAGPAVVLEGYFSLAEPPGLFGQAEDGRLYEYGRTDSDAIFSLAQGEMSAIALAGDPVATDSNDDHAAGLFWPLLMFGGLAAGGIAVTSGGASTWFEPVKPEPGPEPRKIIPAPKQADAIDDVGPITGPIQNHGETDDPRPQFVGHGTPGDVITIYDNDKPIGEAVIDDNGDWSFTPNEDLPEGPHSITTTERDKDGNTSPPSEPLEFGVDRTPPPRPSLGEGLGGAIDDVGTITGPIANRGVTDDTRPEFTGKGTPGDTITIYDKGAEIGKATVDDQGNWSFTPSADLGEGAHSITITESDKAGNVSEPSDPFEFGVDTKAPVPTAHVDGAVDDSGLVASNQPVVSGRGEAGDTITISFPNGQQVSTVVDRDGNWTAPAPSRPLPEGGGVILVTEVDDAGNSSTIKVAVVVDTMPPAAPQIGSVVDDVAPLVGKLSSSDFTDDPTPTLSGTAEAGSTVTIYDNGNKLGTATVDGNGNWTYTPTTPLNEGSHSFTATATDKAGNTGPASQPFALTTDFTAPDPSKLAITGVDDDVGLVTGNVANGATTDDTHPVIHGTGTKDDMIIVSVKDANGTHEVGRATVDANGNWTLAVDTALASDSNTFTAVEMDPAGNKTDPSQPYAIVVDIGRPDVPVIENIQDDVGVVHMLQKGEVTNDATPTIIGTAQAHNTVNIYDGSTLLGTVVADANGKWSFTPDPALADGAHNITATATNPVGQTSDATGIWNFVVDTHVPNPVSGLLVMDDVGQQTGPLVSGDVTDDNRPTFSGKAEPNSIVTVFDGSTVLGQAQVDGDGNWSFTPGTALADGAHSFTTMVTTQPAGNDSARTAPVNVTVDTTGVPVSIDALVDDQGTIQGNIAPLGSTDDTRPEIRGTGKAKSTITVYDGSTVLGTTTVNGDGTWSFTPTGDLGQGSHSITAVQRDTAGNTSDPTSAFVFSVDTIAPNAPSIGSVTDDVGAVQGPLSNGATTDDPTPTLSGTAEAGSTVTIYDNGNKLGAVTADANGNWTYTPTTPLNEGSHSFTATATDKAGNTGPASQPFALTTDFTPPDVTGMTSTFAISTDTANGISMPYASPSTATNADLVTRDTTITVRGALNKALTADQYLQISSDGGQTWTTVLANSGTAWSYTVPTEYTQSTITDYLMRVVDGAGNVGTGANFTKQTVVVDLVAPDAIHTTPVVTGNVDSSTPLHFDSSVYGKSEAGAVVALVDDVDRNGSYSENVDRILGYATVKADGTWSIDASIPTGAHNLGFMVFDAAGNASRMSATTSIGVDDKPLVVQTTNWGGGSDGNGRFSTTSAMTLTKDGQFVFFQPDLNWGTNFYTVTGGGLDGTKTFSTTSAPAGSGNYGGGYGQFFAGAGFGDINRDGNVDLVANPSDYSGNNGTVFMGNSDGTYTADLFWRGTLVHMGGSILFDKEGDGYLDVVYGDSQGDSMQFQYNQSYSSLTTAQQNQTTNLGNDRTLYAANGSREPLVSCPVRGSRQALIDCNAPNRRVEVVGASGAL
jgi:hypothetical protein